MGDGRCDNQPPEGGQMDPIHDAMQEATLAVLLGSTTVPHRDVDDQGNVLWSTQTISSAFADRLRHKVYSGDYDDIIRRVMDDVDAAAVARHVEVRLAEQVIAGLGRRDTYGRHEPNWLQEQARKIAVEACTSALAADEGLLDTLRAKIGAEVDRNRVGITVNLSDPEAS